MAKTPAHLGEERFAIARLNLQNNTVYMETIRANKGLRTEEDANQEARRLAELGQDCFVLEVKRGFGRKLKVTELEITTD